MKYGQFLRGIFVAQEEAQKTELQHEICYVMWFSFRDLHLTIYGWFQRAIRVAMQKSYSEVYSTSAHTFVSMAAVTVGATAHILSSSSGSGGGQRWNVRGTLRVRPEKETTWW